jgi:L-rhamnose mutarotase
MKKYCLACDLKDDELSIKAYDQFHKQVWPEIKHSITSSGILNMEIFRTGNRLFMIIEAAEDFSFMRKAMMDHDNPIVQEWETLMSGFQQPLPWSANGEKWLQMTQIFALHDPS